MNRATRILLIILGVLAGLALVPVAPHALFVPLVLVLLAALPDPP